MKKVITLIFLFVFIIMPVSNSYSEMQSHMTHQHKQIEYEKIKNPVASNNLSVSKGKKLYEKNCAFCHGETAKGSIGPDLTDDVWIHGGSDGEVFSVISNGVQGTFMRGYKKELSKDKRWHLVNYIKSLKIKGKE